MFKNFDIDEGSYIIGDNKFKINELSIDQFEKLQDKEAEINDIEGTTMKASQVLKIQRDFNNYVLDLAFGNKVEEIRKLCNASQYNKMCTEVFVFLGKFSGPSAAREYITILREKKTQQKTK